MMWMPWITLLAFALIAWGAPSWRATAIIILVPTVSNIFLTPWYVEISYHEQAGIILPTIAGCIDFLTGICVLVWGSRGALKQAIVLLFFMISHYSLLAAYVTGYQLIYPVYEEVILALNIIQICLMGGAYAELSGTFRIYRRSLDGWVWKLTHNRRGHHRAHRQD